MKYRLYLAILSPNPAFSLEETINNYFAAHHEIKNFQLNDLFGLAHIFKLPKTENLLAYMPHDVDGFNSINHYPDNEINTLMEQNDTNNPRGERTKVIYFKKNFLLAPTSFKISNIKTLLHTILKTTGLSCSEVVCKLTPNANKKIQENSIIEVKLTTNIITVTEDEDLNKSMNRLRKGDEYDITVAKEICVKPRSRSEAQATIGQTELKNGAQDIIRNFDAGNLEGYSIYFDDGTYISSKDMYIEKSIDSNNIYKDGNINIEKFPSLIQETFNNLEIEWKKNQSS